MPSLGLPELFILFIIAPLAILATVFWVWMIVDCATKERDPDRLVWIVIIVFTHLLGAILYFFIRRQGRTSTPSPAAG